MSSGRIVPGQEYVADTIFALGWQVEIEPGRGSTQKTIRQPKQNASTISGVLFVADTAAMFHAGVHVQSVLDNLSTRATFDVADKADATAVFFVGRVIQTLLFWQSKLADACLSL